MIIIIIMIIIISIIIIIIINFICIGLFERGLQSAKWITKK